MTEPQTIDLSINHLPPSVSPRVISYKPSPRLRKDFPNMPPKDTTASTPKSTASKSAGEGVKRRASGSAEGSGSKAPPGSEASPERTTQPIPIRESRLGGRTPLSKPSGTNPSRPGSSDGPDLKVFSYSHLDANGVETAINPDSDETRREFRIVSDSLSLPSFEKTKEAEELCITNNDPSMYGFPSATLQSFARQQKLAILFPAHLPHFHVSERNPRGVTNAYSKIDSGRIPYRMAILQHWRDKDGTS